MNICDKCKVKIRGGQKICPLCQNKLKDEDNSEDIFPKIPTIFHEHNFFIRVIILISITISVICAVINIIYYPKILWWLFVAVGLACFGADLYFIISKRRNIPGNILYQVIVISLISVVWDFWIGFNGWSINYVIPIVCVLAMAAMSIIAKVSKLESRDYIIYLLIDIVLGIIPAVFVYFNIVKIRIPSIICTASSIIFLAALILFEGENMYSEIKRRFHV